jgi:DNA-binding CsgD family transcriptional regulator
MHADIVDQIYDAAFIPEIFEKLITRLAEMVDCDKAFVFKTDGFEIPCWIANDAAKRVAGRLANEGWMQRNTLGKRVIARREPRFSVDLDIFTDEELNNNPIYTEFLRPEGCGWGTGTMVLGPSGDSVIYSFHRAMERGPVAPDGVARLTALRPHLARAALASSRLQMQQARAIVSALAAIGLPSAAISPQGRLIVANNEFEGLVPDILADFRTRIRFTSKAADDSFASAILRLNDIRAGRGSISFPAQAKEPGKPPAIIHLVPITGNSRDIFVASSWLMIAIPISIGASPDPLVLEGLFDLTTAEARVARAVSIGQSVNSIASENAVSLETVRSQLKMVLHKTGTHRQSELAALLGLAKEI